LLAAEQLNSQNTSAKSRRETKVYFRKRNRAVKRESEKRTVENYGTEGWFMSVKHQKKLKRLCVEKREHHQLGGESGKERK